jgi:Putative peptidoglycan binding domain
LARACARTLIGFLGCSMSVASVLALGPATRLAAEPTSQACFELKFDQPRQPIRRIVLDLDSKDLMVEEWGLSRAPFFDAGMTCKEADQGRLECSIECDGGQLSIAQRENRVELSASHLRLSDKLDTMLSARNEAGSSGALDGTYVLAPAPQATCRTAFGPDRPGQTALRPGDFSPRVESLQKALSNLGFFSQQPDWYFTGVTADAVRAFQRFAGLQPTGQSDAKTIAKLRLLSLLRGGC